MVPDTSGCTSMLYGVPETMPMKNWAAGTLLKVIAKRSSTGCRGRGTSI
ncbi:hypothetical protein RY831_27965 [Noviherbaspirillum sp. CPCC 100848]|uniref:Uncharacterized protein n=2 Tax=Noviherbaspirillum album TaxID=3080276 RepID=A0ABU6JH65_9BURK|nr:hypothetical protein [Noviherbaspirillum sp. CPCC 100848]